MGGWMGRSGLYPALCKRIPFWHSCFCVIPPPSPKRALPWSFALHEENTTKVIRTVLLGSRHKTLWPVHSAAFLSLSHVLALTAYVPRL